MLIIKSKHTDGLDLRVHSLLDLDGDVEFNIRHSGFLSLSIHFNKQDVEELKEHLEWVLENRFPNVSHDTT